MERWWEVHGDGWVSAGDLHLLADESELLGFVIGDKSDRSQKIRLGKALGAMRDRAFGDYKIAPGIDGHTKAAKYRLIPVKDD